VREDDIDEAGGRLASEVDMPVGPVDLLILSFPTVVPDGGVVAAVQEAVDAGLITVLDLVFVIGSPGGGTVEIDADDALRELGLAALGVQGQKLIGEDDLEVARDIVVPGRSAAVIVYEHSWARKIAGAIADSGGELSLHVRIPRDVVEASLEATEMD
jgi:hypothetical protein